MTIVNNVPKSAHNTERPITVTDGTNRLCTPEDIETQAQKAMAHKPTSKPPLFWDGKTAERVVESARCFFLEG